MKRRKHVLKFSIDQLADAIDHYVEIKRLVPPGDYKVRIDGEVDSDDNLTIQATYTEDNG